MMLFLLLVAAVFGVGGVIAWRTHRHEPPPPGTGSTGQWNNGGGPTAGS